THLEDDALENIRKIVEETPTGKIADFYKTWMDEARANQLGIAPLKTDLTRIRAIKSMSEVFAELGRQQRYRLQPLIGRRIDQDARKATEYAVYLSQAGLGLPDRDYYLKDDPKMEDARKAYIVYIEKIFKL